LRGQFEAGEKRRRENSKISSNLGLDLYAEQLLLWNNGDAENAGRENVGHKIVTYFSVMS